MSEIVVRAARLDDAPAVLEIYRPSVTETAVSFELAVPSVEEITDRIQKALEGWAWLVAEEDGALAGYAYGTAHRARAAYRWSVETSAYVAGASRGKGVGKLLYSHLLPALADRGFCNAYAGIVLPNDASIALHRAAGFEPIGVFCRAGWKYGAWHDVSWWQRQIRETPPG
jgi:L-amino acid N-acyltransferase YncA